ncbi:hypothetical protein ABB37_00891 [Leptomonas pyrrhocoris]|uniref:Uncharacterized protein n=1 Tax=Leptomonas pyrrhocoris TaxID=157538 RepID=A0A0M9GBK1_LEPPY|nr:hypothetical protein ABB37_00891 [Leptomonas pyrrhocoris]KPA86839.1 hypothetical protein ABB37_00891 [Leptomonas pyrrhocoris]|eukprot:XP_015665278.1 hypothetical protein ABB37_00891 [Leptomonas pyrrhocoris]
MQLGRSRLSRHTCLRPLVCLMERDDRYSCSLCFARRPLHVSPRNFFLGSRGACAVARAPPPVSLHGQLEARLLVSPITPNEALMLLACAFPAVCHIGVVEHLVHVIRGNACCLDPSLCLSFIARLLFPALPCGLCSMDDERDLEDELMEGIQRRVPLVATSLNDAAVRVALTPLCETLAQCIMISLQVQLAETHVPCTQARCDSTAQLWEKRAGASCFGSEAMNNGRGQTFITDESALLERGAALLLALVATPPFSLPPTFTKRDGLQNSDDSPGGLMWQKPVCASLMCAAVQRLMERGAADCRASGPGDTSLPKLSESSAASRAMHSARAAGATTAAHGVVTPTEGLYWVRFCKAAQRCWHWSMLVCCATPMLPSRALRAFAVDSLVESLQKLHQCLAAESENDQVGLRSALSGVSAWSRRLRVACAEVLSWLLTRSLPAVNAVKGVKERSLADEGGTAAGADARNAGHRCLWTTELRSALLVLANDFADVAIYLVQEGVSCCLRHNDTDRLWSEQVSLVPMMTSVAFRLSLQFAASPPRSTPAALSEVNVARRLVYAVSSLNLRIGVVSPACAASAAASAEAINDTTRPMDDESSRVSKDPSYVLIAEETWCKLACVQRFVLSKTSVSLSNQASSPAVSLVDEMPLEHILPYERLLRIGVLHLSLSSTSMMAGLEKDEECVTGCQQDAADTLRQMGMASTTDSTPLFSLEFIFTFVRCWRAWLHACPGASCVGWLGGMVDSGGVSPATAARRTLGGRMNSQNGTSLLKDHNSVAETRVVLPAAKDTREKACFFDAENSLPSLHQLSLWLVETWVASLSSEEQDRSPLDVCACWSALSTPPLVRHSTVPASPRATHEILFACEQRLSRQCGDYLSQACNARHDPTLCGLLQRCEMRPRLCKAGEAAPMTAGLDGADDASNRRWRPMYAPPFISHVGLRLLRAESLLIRGEFADAGDDGLRLPLAETVVDLLRRTIESPLSMEVTFFQLSMITKYVEWCEAAAVHTGWGTLSVEDCRREADGDENVESDASGRTQLGASAPWCILTVEGFPSSSGLPGKADMAALVYLWRLCDGAATAVPQQKSMLRAPTGEGNGVGSVREKYAVMPYDRSLCAVSPLSVVEASYRRGAQPWLRQAVDQWTRRYAFRLLLFLLQEESWQRYRKATSHHRIAAAPSPLTKSIGVGPKAWEPTYAAPFHSPRSHVGGTRTCALPSVLMTPDQCHSFLWRSDAWQPLLCSAARRLLKRVAQLTTEVHSYRRLFHSGVPCTVEDARHEVALLLHRLSGHFHIERTRSSLAACVVAALASIREGESCSLSDTTSDAKGHSTFSPWFPSPHHSQPLADPVRELEEKLMSLGLAASSTFDRCGSSDRIGIDQTVGEWDDGDADDTAASVAEEARAMLTTLCAAPALTFLTSPRVLRFTEEVWRTCWVWLLQFSRDTVTGQRTHHRCDGTSETDSMWRDAHLISETAELDALVSCRAMLHATRHFHVLAAELLEYLCTVYVPALTASADGFFSCFVTTPVEALERQLTAGDATCDSQVSCCAPLQLGASDRGNFRFSASSLRTYEVLCLGCFGKGERRPPCVWQRWMQELVHGDAALQEHRLVHWRSRLAC